MLRLSFALPLTLALMPIAAQAQDCDTVWTALRGVPGVTIPAPVEGESEELTRYRAGAEIFAAIEEEVSGLDVATYEASGGVKMLAALKLNFGDQLLTCYQAPAAEEAADFVAETEAAMPAEERAALVTAWSLSE
ncbi:hypothetical protein [Pseudoroseicyclus sp. CXY001]|uniref:hypothetical protein n=1 Tax=Pseudoroseicyclus sp. CXY001 TaxID=3242492 RepID=UPI00358DA92A